MSNWIGVSVTTDTPLKLGHCYMRQWPLRANLFIKPEACTAHSRWWSAAEPPVMWLR